MSSNEAVYRRFLETDLRHGNMQLRFLLIVLLLPIYSFSQTSPASNQSPPILDKQDYVSYNRAIAQAQALVSNKQFQEALAIYQQVITTYSYVFLREYQAATQLALYMNRDSEALNYLKQGISNGWTWKSIRKNRILNRLSNSAEWHQLKKQYPTLRKSYLHRVNSDLRNQVQSMFRKDQRKALGALFTFSPSKQDRYAEKRFAPHSEKQMARLTQMINTHGFPSEQLIGNSYWATVIVSHHNSVSQRFVLQDTLYPAIRPRLMKALEVGQLSPYELATIEDWYVAVKSGRSQKAYGYLDDSLTAAEADSANVLRDRIGLSRIETINRLVDIQEQTGMNFYLPFRSSGKTRIR